MLRQAAVRGSPVREVDRVGGAQLNGLGVVLHRPLEVLLLHGHIAEALQLLRFGVLIAGLRSARGCGRCAARLRCRGPALFGAAATLAGAGRAALAQLLVNGVDAEEVLAGAEGVGDGGLVRGVDLEEVADALVGDFDGLAVLVGKGAVTEGGVEEIGEGEGEALLGLGGDCWLGRLEAALMGEVGLGRCAWDADHSGVSG